MSELSISCRHCRELLLDAHGNRRIHKHCNKARKDEQSAEQYARKSMKADRAWKNDAILAELYNHHENGHEFEPEALIAEGLVIALYLEERKIDGYLVYCMRRFGFYFLKNTKIILCKL